MSDYESSSQLKSWLFTLQILEQCRVRANKQAIDHVLSLDQSSNNDETDKYKPPVYSFARGYTNRVAAGDAEDQIMNHSTAQATTAAGHAFVTPSEESLLVNFYASKLPSLLGPTAQVARLRRDVKVPSTAALLFRRFFLSNSVLLHDPKAVMLAAAFLASKVEDATTDIRYLEEGTKLMNAPVTTAEMIPAELALIEGIHFDLQCFHPYKAVTAFTEDLRMYLKSEKGRTLVQQQQHGRSVAISGQDLKPMHDRARLWIDDVIVSDVPLLYSPGQIGLAALMVASEELLEEQAQQPAAEMDPPAPALPKIDLFGYVHQRFDRSGDEFMIETMHQLCSLLKGLKAGEHGCAVHQVDMQTLKAVHKKLKKCRLWGQSSNGGRKGKKRKAQTDGGPVSKIRRDAD